MIATQVSKTTGQSSGSETVTTKWKPHVIFGVAEAGSGIYTIFLCGEDNGGTMQYQTVGHDASNSLYRDNSNVSCKDTGGNGWTASISFESRGYTITWTKNSSGLNADFEFIAIRAKNCYYNAISRAPGDGSSTDSHTGYGFDPDVVFAHVRDSSNNNPSVGWGAYIDATWQESHQGSQYHRDGGSDYMIRHQYIGIQTGNPYDGWRIMIEGISDGISVDWLKWVGGINCTLHTWALEFYESDTGDYTGVPSDGTNLTSGMSSDPLVSISAGHVTDYAFGVQTENAQVGMTVWGWKSFGAYTSDTRREGPDSSNYYAVDHTFTSGNTREDVSTTGSPGNPGGEGRSGLAFAGNSGLGGVG